MKILILSIFALLLVAFSCEKEAEKGKFIQDVIKSPDKLDQIIKSSPFETEDFVKQYFPNDSSKRVFIEKLSQAIKKHFSGKFEVYCDREVEEPDPTTGTHEHIHEIAIFGTSKDNTILFRWSLEFGKWHLYDIKFTSMVYCN
jgi:hypothetical protein